jgi:hypothetical protein
MPTDPREIAVFLGPTIPRHAASDLLRATYLPPVQQGSVYDVARNRPRAIVLIDGYFNWVPAVWHKEILWALAQGIPVYGAASMGALRAAELHSFGMIGFGAVFQDFLTGRLHDDDEVAVVHADASAGFLPFSDALVNIRCTLAAAELQEVISASAVAALIGYCKEQFFPDRSLERLLLDATRLALLPKVEMDRLKAWLPGNVCDIKRKDAEGLLRELAEEGATLVTPDRSRFVFESTVNWLQLATAIDAAKPAPTSLTTQVPIEEVAVDDVLAECRLTGRWPEVEAMALARLLVAHARPSIASIAEEDYFAELAKLCLQLGMENLEQLSSWLENTGYDASRFAVLVEREALLRHALDYWSNDLREAAIDVLNLTGRRPRLLERARQKREWLTSIGERAALLTEDPKDSLAWFRDRIGASDREPDVMLAKRNGWSSVSDMTEDLLCEYHFQERHSVSMPLTSVASADVNA